MNFSQLFKLLKYLVIFFIITTIIFPPLINYNPLIILQDEYTNVNELKISLNNLLVPRLALDGFLSEDTIAYKIYLSMNAVTDWHASSNLFARGIVLGKVSTTEIDSLIQKKQSENDWQEVFTIKLYAEILSYSSSTINESVKWALNYTPMFKRYALPMTESGGYFWIWKQYTLHAYRYARELNYLTTKWDALSAFNALKNCRITNGRSFYQCNPDTNKTESLFNTRWMNTANLASCFMVLYNEIHQQDILDYALQEWKDLNTFYWNEKKIGFEYSRTWKIWEWSTIEVFFNYEKLRTLNGSLSRWERIYFDLQSRYLVHKWNSPLWNSVGKVIVHYEGNSQRRLHGTLDAWMLLHSYFGGFSSQCQYNMQVMLEGSPNDEPAWKGLLSASAALYDPITYRFKRDSTSGTTSDFGTAEGCITLFLLGISPQNGSGLIIPKRCHDYSGEPFPIDIFRFCFHKQQILLPVYAKTTLRFLYGTSYPSYTFPVNGLYLITFSSDWSSILQVELINGIIADIPSAPSYPSDFSSSSRSTFSLSSLSSSKSDNSENKTNETSSNVTDYQSTVASLSIIGVLVCATILVIKRNKNRKYGKL